MRRLASALVRMAGLLLGLSPLPCRAQEPPPRIVFDPGEQGPVASGSAETIAVGRLAHKIPSAALQQFQTSFRDEKNGKPEEAFRRLNEAVRLDPQYWEALARLADIHWRAGRPAEALLYLDRAIALDGGAERLHSNRALALLELGRLAEAEDAARRAIQIDPSSPAHYVAALAQIRQDRITAETAAHLKRVVGTVPQAERVYRNVTEYLSQAKP